MGHTVQIILVSSVASHAKVAEWLDKRPKSMF